MDSDKSALVAMNKITNDLNGKKSTSDHFLIKWRSILKLSKMLLKERPCRGSGGSLKIYMHTPHLMVMKLSLTMI